MVYGTIQLGAQIPSCATSCLLLLRRTVYVKTRRPTAFVTRHDDETTVLPRDIMDAMKPRWTAAVRSRVAGIIQAFIPRFGIRNASRHS